MIVSNFTTALDTIHTLLQSTGWGNVLRLDGKVPVELRQGLVNRYVERIVFTVLYLLRTPSKEIQHFATTALLFH